MLNFPSGIYSLMCASFIVGQLPLLGSTNNTDFRHGLHSHREKIPNFKRTLWPGCILAGKIGKDPDPISTIFDGKYLVKNCDLILQKKSSLKLMIFVISAPGNKYERNAIRMTWGHYALRRDVAITFIISIKQWEKDNENHTYIQQEINEYNDIVIPKYKDSYNKLTLKTVYILHWVNSCGLNFHDTYVLKTDDDMHINVPLLLKIINKIEGEDKIERKIYGNIHALNFPYRDNNPKYSVSCEQYQYLMYPNFTGGPGYFFSSSLTQPLLQTALKTPFLKLEDVFLTGIVAETLEIPRVHLKSFINGVNKTLARNCEKNTAIVMVDALTEDLFIGWSLCNVFN